MCGVPLPSPVKTNIFLDDTLPPRNHRESTTLADRHVAPSQNRHRAASSPTIESSNAATARRNRPQPFPYPPATIPTHRERERKVGGGVGKDGSQITACREGGLTGRRMGKIGQRRSEWSRARGTRWCKRRPREQDSRGGPRRNVVELVARAGRGNADRRRRQPRSMEVGVGGGIGWGRVDGRERRVRLGIDKW